MTDAIEDTALPAMHTGQLKPYASLLVIERVDDEVLRAFEVMWKIVERTARKVRAPTSVALVASAARRRSAAAACCGCRR